MMNPTKVSFSFILLFSLSNLVCRSPAAIQNNGLHASKTLFPVGVVLDLGTPLGKMSRTCISMALDDFYTAHNNYITRLNLTWMDSNQDIVDAASMAQNLLKNVQVKAIIGPQASDQAQFVAAMGNKAHVPILSFSATSPFISTIQTPYFIRTALSDSSQVKPIAALIKAFEWREVVQICEDTLYGNGMIPFMTDALQDVEARVPYRSVISHLMNDDQIADELRKLKTMQTRVFIVHLSPSLSSRLFFKANEVGMMNEECVWIVTDGLANLLGSMNSSVIESMQGVLGVRPNVPKSKELGSFREKWNRKFQNENPNLDRGELNIFGLWAYDTISALSKVVEKVHTTRKNTTDMGPALREAILETNFKGLSGQFNLTGGQLESSTFEIVNVIGGARVVGFWTPIQGLDKKLDSSKKNYSTSKDDLNPIIWPGESQSVPKGWVIPTSGKKLKIGVPRKLGFTEFVNATLDPETNQTKATGYSIDVFKAAVRRLPYAVECDYFVYQDEHGEPKGSYNDLIMEVYKKVFPRGSPLVPDLSRAILNLTEGEDMKTIEKAWIGPASTCSDQPTTAQSNRLTLGSFWGLFLITGAASLSALSIYLFSFLKRNRHVLTTRDPNLSFHQRLIAIFRHFNERDISHHTFIRRARPNGSLEMATIQAENSPPVDASVPTIISNPNGRDSVFLTEAEDVEQHFQTFNCEPVARRRWNLISRAWRFRNRYAHLHEYN